MFEQNHGQITAAKLQLDTECGNVHCSFFDLELLYSTPMDHTEMADDMRHRALSPAREKASGEAEYNCCFIHHVYSIL